MAYNVSGLISQFQSAEAQARAANIKREQELRTMYGKIEERYAPGGAFEVGGLAQIEAAGVKGRGQEMQQLISSGMYGTTTAAGIPSRWEAEVGTPARLKLEDISRERLTQAEMAKAGFIERIQDTYPDYGPLMQALQAASSVGGGAGPSTGYKGAYIPDSGSAFGRTTPAPMYGMAARPSAAAPTAPTPTRAAPTAARPGAVVKPTVAEQHLINQRLKAMYPQMTKPGWGTPAPAAKPKTSWWSKVGTAFGGGF